MKKVQNTPLNRLFLAINHYVSTGDHIGEGLANDLGTYLEILILVNPNDSVDLSDFEKFTLRFAELEEEFSTALVYEGLIKGFHTYTFLLDLIHVDAMAEKLTEKPGPKGWGSMYDLIQKHFPTARRTAQR